MTWSIRFQLKPKSNIKKSYGAIASSNSSTQSSKSAIFASNLRHNSKSENNKGDVNHDPSQSFISNKTNDESTFSYNDIFHFCHDKVDSIITFASSSWLASAVSIESNFKTLKGFLVASTRLRKKKKRKLTHPSAADDSTDFKIQHTLINKTNKTHNSIDSSQCSKWKTQLNKLLIF